MEERIRQLRGMLQEALDEHLNECNPQAWEPLADSHPGQDCYPGYPYECGRCEFKRAAERLLAETEEYVR